MHGRGAEIHRVKSPRIGVERKQLDHGPTYITSPHVIQDLPFGQRYLRLSSGEVLETPNVISTMIRSRLVKQYQVYCEETKFHSIQPSNYAKGPVCLCSHRQEVPTGATLLCGRWREKF